MKQKILLIKTSSFGDVLHLLPALSDARQQRPDLAVDWVVEESFAEIATWHPSVAQVIPVAVRRWRGQLWKSIASGELLRFVRTLRAESYQQVIDAQGLLKSAVITRLARGERYGLDRRSARESLASRCYQTPLAVGREQHALDRLRQLLALALRYPVPATLPDYGLEARFGKHQAASGYWVFLHGTTWASKHWPEAYWLQLAELCAAHGQIILPWGTARELARAHRIASVAPGRIVPAERTNLTQLATLLIGARAVVAVDTGPAHLAAALGVPVIGLYGPTNPKRTGTVGPQQQHMQGRCVMAAVPCLKRECPATRRSVVYPPCWQLITPDIVLEALLRPASRMDG